MNAKNGRCQRIGRFLCGKCQKRWVGALFKRFMRLFLSVENAKIMANPAFIFIDAT